MQLPVHLERFVQVYPRSFFTDTKATMVVDCTVGGKNNKEDKTNLWVAGVQLPVHLHRFVRAHCGARLFVSMMMMMMMAMMMINPKSQ